MRHKMYGCKMYSGSILSKTDQFTTKHNCVVFGYLIFLNDKWRSH